MTISLIFNEIFLGILRFFDFEYAMEQEHTQELHVTVLARLEVSVSGEETPLQVR